MSELEQILLANFEKARRRLIGIQPKQAAGAEREYSQTWDKLAQREIGNRRRLREKYRT